MCTFASTKIEDARSLEFEVACSLLQIEAAESDDDRMSKDTVVRIAHRREFAFILEILKVGWHTAKYWMPVTL
jgi:hypothetical protein